MTGMTRIHIQNLGMILTLAELQRLKDRYIEMSSLEVEDYRSHHPLDKPHFVYLLLASERHAVMAYALRGAIQCAAERNINNRAIEANAARRARR